MHSRNIYRNNPPDFESLAKAYPVLQQHFKASQDNTVGVYNFQNPQAIIDLTQSLLNHDFQLDVQLPIENLCPRLANRLNYILWIEDLLNETTGSGIARQGLDVGCGASCIYPLLACRHNPDWTFLATDINHQSLLVARENVSANALEDQIRIVEKSPKDSFFDFSETLDFTMCNPPFYASPEEITELESFKHDKPRSKLLAHPNELITEGGEIQFIRKMFEDSYTYVFCNSLEKRKNHQTWFTTMIGKQSTLHTLIPLLKSKYQLDNYVITTLVQGQHTRRWVLGWSFGYHRASDSISRISQTNSPLKSLNPPVTEILVNLSSTEGFQAKLESTLSNLVRYGLSWEKSGEHLNVTVHRVRVPNDIWSRSFRRAWAKRQDDSSKPESKRQKLNDGLGYYLFTITLVSVKDPQLRIRWNYGVDFKIYESFVGMIKRACT
ncbi:hypothetical protein NADFUDRAFT_50279 [Nadsonia fulvescens var. elongata DSM 6958]|uniref:U6 small nuclear RNA (adenine-(43)-N(6))-methyltransferase n=1 Tax=Nadsonia fulvescens var. elongata DSM 6958 TaxID=857566 RepID=A0A1E3PLQ5_9ASCO|nr:hypothetical protein NADFUDRAFT_50279 [Nadsonia fulvescens var. elongata DSM 6958]